MGKQYEEPKIDIIVVEAGEIACAVETSTGDTDIPWE